MGKRNYREQMEEAKARAAELDRKVLELIAEVKQARREERMRIAREILEEEKS